MLPGCRPPVFAWKRSSSACAAGSIAARTRETVTAGFAHAKPRNTLTLSAQLRDRLGNKLIVSSKPKTHQLRGYRHKHL